MQYTRFIALGDSMTEGMTDEVINGKYRGWADRAADVFAKNNPNFTYMNLAIRGKLLRQVVEDQIPHALKYIKGKETLVSFHAGANDVLRPNYNPAVSFAARMPISQVTNLVRSIEDAKKAGCFVVGLDAQGDATLAKMNLATESIFIIVGSEGKGLSRLVREKCDLVVSIPMQSSVESLNASVATAIVMYQVAAERSK